MTDTLAGRLQAVHDRLADEPLPERLAEASCGPNVKHLAHLALHAATAGATPEQWRAWARAHVPEASTKLLVEAEECMRSGGLWPWHDQAP
jgi:hypothetical protein